MKKHSFQCEIEMAICVFHELLHIGYIDELRNFQEISKKFEDHNTEHITSNVN